jgi:hypothetical protein
MPNFQLIRPNFYTQNLSSTNAAGLNTNAAGLISVQASGNKSNGNFYSARNTQNRSTPGVAAINNIGLSTPTVALQGLVNTTQSVPTMDVSQTPVNNSGQVNSNSPSGSRLATNNLPAGGDYSTGINTSVAAPTVTFNTASTNKLQDSTEYRAKITDQTGLFIGTSSVFTPLTSTGGVIFPYTPTITVSHQASYDLENLIHSNYSTPYYTASKVDNISVQARFTAQTPSEAQYVLAMIHFFRTVTKMFYGQSSNKGTPPPVLFFDAHGSYMFDHVPVVISNFNYTMPNDVNYITTSLTGSNGLLTPTNVSRALTGGNGPQTSTVSNSMVPVDLTIQLDMIPTFSRNLISNTFGLDKFANGGLIVSPYTTGPGGWI